MTEPPLPSSLPSSQPNLDLSLEVLSANLVYFFGGKPLEQRQCAKSLFGSLEKIRGHEGWLAELQQNNHDFWKGLIQFISSPRKVEDFSSLDQGLSDCHCDLEDAVVKRLHEVQPIETSTIEQTPFHAFISKLLEILHDRLTKVDYTQVCSATRSNPLALWPTLTSDLLPFGGEVAVKSFLQWAEMYDLPIAHAALCRVLMCTRSLVRPYLMENKNFRRSVLDRFEPINQPTSDTLTLTQKKALVDLLEDVLECIGTAFDMQGEHSVMEWIGADAPKFITLANNALALTFPRSEFAKSNFQDGRASGFATLINYLRSSPYMMMNSMSGHWHSEDHIEVQKLMIRSFPGGPPEQRYFTVLSKIYQFRAARQECSALGCGVKAEQMEDSALRLCSGCRCVTYCSEKCQLAEWKSPMFAHKKACKTFRVFMPYVEDLKDGIIRKTAKKCVEDGVPMVEAMNAEFFLGLMERHREEFIS